MQLTAQESITSLEVTTSACHKLSGSHLGTAEVHTSAGTLCSWTASVLPKGLDWLWKTTNTFEKVSRNPVLVAKGLRQTQTKVCSQQKPLLAIFHCLKSLSTLQEVTMEHSSQRIKVCSNTLLFLKAQHCKKEQALPSTLSLVWTQHHRNTYFASSLVGLLTIFTLWRGLETSTSLRIYGMRHYTLRYRYSFCFSHTVKLNTTTHLEFKWQQSFIFFGCTIPFLPWASITMSWTFLYLFRDCRSSSIFRS